MTKRRGHSGVAWVAGLVLLVSAVSGRASAATLREKLVEIMVPKVQFEEASIKDVIAWLRAKSRELDPAETGINILFKQSPKADAPSRAARVTLDMENISLRDVIHYVCLATDLKYQVDANVVLIGDPDVILSSHQMQTRIFRIKAGGAFKAPATQRAEPIE